MRRIRDSEENEVEETDALDHRIQGGAREVEESLKRAPYRSDNCAVKLRWHPKTISMLERCGMDACARNTAMVGMHYTCISRIRTLSIYMSFILTSILSQPGASLNGASSSSRSAAWAAFRRSALLTKPACNHAPMQRTAHVVWAFIRLWMCERRRRPLLNTLSTSTEVARMHPVRTGQS